MAVEIYNPAGVIVRRSQNLRAVSRHCAGRIVNQNRITDIRRGAPSLILIDPSKDHPGKALVQFTWGNGDSCDVVFADKGIAIDWCLSRQFLFGAEISIDANLYDNASLRKGPTAHNIRDLVSRHFKLESVANGTRAFLTPRV